MCGDWQGAGVKRYGVGIEGMRVHRVHGVEGIKSGHKLGEGWHAAGFKG